MFNHLKNPSRCIIVLPVAKLTLELCVFKSCFDKLVVSPTGGSEKFALLCVYWCLQSVVTLGN